MSSKKPGKAKKGPARTAPENHVSFLIGGMTCVNCQNTIERALGQVPGVRCVHVSYTKGTADIEYNPKKCSLQDLEKVIQGRGYQVLTGNSGQWASLFRTAGLLLLLVVLYVLLQKTGILNLLAPSQLADTGMGYGMLFVIGLITSVHCIAMCGGINLSQSLPQRGAAQGGGLRALRPALLYNLGRVISYTAVGAVLGLLGFLLGGGTQVGMGVLLQGGLKMLAGIFMVVMGINMLGLFPGLRGLTLRMPRGVARLVNGERAKGSRPFCVGLLNGLMPCGPLQSMWLVALATGNPLAGGLSMLLFSLGTVPLMLGLGSIVSILGTKFTHQVTTVGAVLVTVLGLAMLSQGGALSGLLSNHLLLFLVIVLSVVGILLSIPAKKRAVKAGLQCACLILAAGSLFLWCHRGLFTGAGQASASEVELIDGVQVVYSTLESGSYPDITVQVGIPVKWIIDAPQGSVNGCNYKVLINDLDLEYTFSTGENIIEFTPLEVGTIQYHCWMGMIYGTIQVVA